MGNPNSRLVLRVSGTAGRLALAWSLRGSRLRLLVWLVGVPTLTAGLNLAYLVSIPSYFLIEPDTARERTDWQEHCFVPDISLLQVRTPVTQPHGGVGEWWVHERSGRYSLLGLPNCRVIDADLPMPTVQPAGISETTTLSIGDAPDVVYVIRTTDGADVLRKYIARYSRSQVVFFEGGLFGYSERDGTHVLRVPIEAGTR